MTNKGTQLSTNQLMLIKHQNPTSVGNGTGPEDSSWFQRHRMYRRLPKVSTWGYCLSYQYYQLKPSPYFTNHLGLSVFNCYSLIVSRKLLFYLWIRMICYIVFQLVYLDINPLYFSVQWLDAILSRIRVIHVLCYANEFMFVYHNES